MLKFFPLPNTQKPHHYLNFFIFHSFTLPISYLYQTDQRALPGNIPVRIFFLFTASHSKHDVPHLLTYLLTPCSRVLLKKLTGFQLVKKFPAFYGTRMFIIAVTSARMSPTTPLISYFFPLSCTSVSNVLTFYSCRFANICMLVQSLLSVRDNISK